MQRSAPSEHGQVARILPFSPITRIPRTKCAIRSESVAGTLQIVISGPEWADGNRGNVPCAAGSTSVIRAATPRFAAAVQAVPESMHLADPRARSSRRIPPSGRADRVLDTTDRPSAIASCERLGKQLQRITRRHVTQLDVVEVADQMHSEPAQSGTTFPTSLGSHAPITSLLSAEGTA